MIYTQKVQKNNYIYVNTQSTSVQVDGGKMLTIGDLSKCFFNVLWPVFLNAFLGNLKLFAKKKLVKKD